MTSLARYTAEYFGVPYGSIKFLHIYECSLKYLTRTISASEMHKRVKKVSNRSVKVFRLGLIEEGYYLLNVKMWLIHACANRKNLNWDAEKELRVMNIMKRDRKYLPRLLADPEIRKQVRVIILQLGGRSKIPTIAYLKDLLARVMIRADVKLKPLINNLVWTKVKFLIQCGSIDYDSVKCELKAKIIQTFYWLSPYRKESIDHWVHSMIKPIKNFSVNLINFHTTQKRTRMILEEGVYRVIETSVDALEDQEGVLSDEGITQGVLEAQITVSQLFRQYAITEKRIKAFKLMSGVYDEDFTRWLKVSRCISANSSMDNTDYQEQIDNEDFLKLIAKYVKLKWEYFKQLIFNIKNKLRIEGEGDYESSQESFA